MNTPNTCRTCLHCIGDFCRVAYALGDPAARLIYVKPDDTCELWTDEKLPELRQPNGHRD